MNNVCYKKVLDQAEKNQTLLFITNTRKQYFIHVKAIDKETITQFVKSKGATRKILLEEANNLKGSNLKDLVHFRFGIHYAGMTREDHMLV